jgi:hypothetical protein
MDSTFTEVVHHLRPTRVHVIGVGAALLVFGVLLNLPAFEVHLPFGGIDVRNEATEPTFADRSFTTAALFLGVVLSWLFAERAARPGWRQGVIAAVGLDVAAVVVGSFLVAGQAAFADTGGGIAAALAVGLLGLVFIGVPMFVLVFVPSMVWVGVVRAAATVLGLRRPPPDGEPTPTWRHP